MAIIVSNRIALLFLSLVAATGSASGTRKQERRGGRGIFRGSAGGNTRGSPGGSNTPRGSSGGNNRGSSGGNNRGSSGGNNRGSSGSRSSRGSGSSHGSAHGSSHGSAHGSFKAPKGSSKAPKNNNRHPRTQCLAEGFAIKGPTDPQNSTVLIAACCDTQALCDVTNSSTYDQDCVTNFHLTYPFRHEFGDIADEYQFTNQDAILGNGSFKGSLPGKKNSEIIKLIYNSELYEADNRRLRRGNKHSKSKKNDNDIALWNRPVVDLDYIEYSFKPESCGNAGSPCPDQFYLNVYTRISTSSTEYYDCSYEFVPTTGGIEGLPTGTGWTTVRFGISDLASDTNTFEPVDPNANPPERCPRLGNNSLQAAADEGYVLGTNEQPSTGSGMGQIFALNMVDLTLGDAELVGYFDKVVINLKDGSSMTYDL